MPASLTEAVLAWGLPRMRDLPWRRTRDPWAILVSEVMLQQTQVARVIPKWASFMDRYPTPADCALASLGEVLIAWQGLGYPRRARALHLAAGELAASGMPTTVDGWMALPGVGAYTARAVMVFALGADLGVVDTNIARVLARLAGTRMTPLEVRRAADQLVPGGHGWEWNQVLMDLGATVCRAAQPRCSTCPAGERCMWQGRGDDPAHGSAGVSRAQPRFAGSDRQLRGRLLRAVAEAPVGAAALAAAIGCERVRAERVAAALVAEGLLRRAGGYLSLPD